MKGDCETCGHGDVSEFELMGCYHQRWKEIRTKYVDDLNPPKVDCWYPVGSLDVIRETEEEDEG